MKDIGWERCGLSTFCQQGCGTVMGMKNTFLLLAAAAAITMPVMASSTMPVMASSKDDKSDQKAASAALARGEILPIARVLAIATARVPGDVLKVELEREAVGFTYEVKILAASGRVREVEVDARTGRIIKIEDD